MPLLLVLGLCHPTYSRGKCSWGLPKDAELLPWTGVSLKETGNVTINSHYHGIMQLAPWWAVAFGLGQHTVVLNK